MIVHLIRLLLFATFVVANPHSVLERYEERLNSALSKRTGPTRTIKRYKCVEEYVTIDHEGKAISSYQGTRFTSTMKPPTYKKPSDEREIRRKPAKKVTIAINRDASTTTTSIPIPMTTTTTTSKPFDEMNDEEADRIIEEMYLKKKESHAVTESPVPERTTTQMTTSYATDATSSPKFSTVTKNAIDSSESGEDYGEYRRSRKRPYDMSNYDEYDDMPIYRSLRREYRMRRRRPLVFADDFSDDTDFEHRLENTPRRQTTRDLSPLRSMKRLRHQAPLYRPPAPMSLPVSSSTNIIHPPMPLAPAPPPMRMPSPPSMPLQTVAQPPGSLSPQLLQPIQQQSSLAVGGGEVLKMKPILQANPQEMQMATAESCSKITKLAKSFSIKDVSKWARGNCGFLQMYAPTASCELIFTFIDSCKSKKFF